jgi:hypothetical protein
LIRNNKLEARQFFLFHFKGTTSQDQQKTNRCRLITFKVTLTGQSHFMRIFLLRKVTLRCHINSVKWTPHPQASVSPPLNQRRGDTISCGWGANSDDWRKSLALCLLCATYKRNTKSANQMNFTVHCTVYSRINSVKSLYAIASTPYNECTRLHQLRTMNVRSLSTP